MGRSPRFTVGLAAFALLLAGGAGVAAAGQADGGLDRQPRVSSESKIDLRSAAAARGRDRRPSRAAAEQQAPAASAPSNGSSGSTGPGASSGAASPTGQANASPVAVATAPPLSGLSDDAPETAPNVGVIGGGGSSSGSSPSATPEPSTLLLMGAGLAGLYRLRRQR